MIFVSMVVIDLLLLFFVEIEGDGFFIDFSYKIFEVFDIQISEDGNKVVGIVLINFIIDGMDGD